MKSKRLTSEQHNTLHIKAKQNASLQTNHGKTKNIKATQAKTTSNHAKTITSKSQQNNTSQINSKTIKPKGKNSNKANESKSK